MSGRRSLRRSTRWIDVVLHVQSLGDPRVAHYRRMAEPKYLHEAGLFVAEGRLVVQRLLASPHWATRSVLVTPTALDGLGTALEAFSPTLPIYVVDQALMNEIAGFHIHRGCLALAARPTERLLDQPAADRASRVVVLERVSNPDNVGGIFRSAAAFGADLVVLGPDCGDPLYRKAVRTSMAATLLVPFVQAGPWPEAIALLRAGGVTVMALTPDPGAIRLSDLRIARGRVAVLAGAEGDGLSAEALDAADLKVRIPMTATVDSLNVATAVSIAMYHAFGLH